MSVIGVPREVKDHEDRVALTPAGAKELVSGGHRVVVETGAGAGSRFSDEEYRAAGAEIGNRPEDVWGRAEVLLKVKEPVPTEFPFLREDLILFTYLHLAADRPLTLALTESRTTAIAYETMSAPDGSLPLLTPMSEIAGRMAAIVGAALLFKAAGGSGVLMPGAPGVRPAKVVVIGAGVAGISAMRVASGLEAEVVILDKNIARLRDIDRLYQGRVQTLASNRLTVESELADADVAIGAVLVPGARAPRVVDAETVASMRAGSVVVDISIDQGGCFETSRMTTHSDPTYVEEGVLHYCVGNMPGAVPQSSTRALTNATLPYVAALAAHGIAALRDDACLAGGLNSFGGSITNESVGAAHDVGFLEIEEALAS